MLFRLIKSNKIKKHNKFDIMLPKFTADRTLPPGIYEATIAEFETRFATNLKRKYLFGRLIELMGDLRKIGCETIYIDGSYVTEKELPSDMDICWENDKINLQDARTLLPALFNRTLQKSIYGADIFPANIMESSSGKHFIDFFQTDKETGQPKGIVKIKLT